MRYMSVLVVLVTVAFSCSRDKNPVNVELPDNGSGVLSIQTDKVSYTWTNGEGGLHLYLNGTVTNTGKCNLYSRLSANPDFGSWDEPFCCIAGNSWGQIEKYNTATDSWENTEIEGWLIEGSAFLTLESKTTYPLQAPLSNRSDNRDAGQYRIAKAFTLEQNPGEAARKYRAFSNTFEIR
ncbi:MAG TPA: hypothetical protein PLP19_12265 [bacterium]|nr:hypothetical protein [bacterium]HPN44258.1 hypothetical protein [bacterium]